MWLEDVILRKGESMLRPYRLRAEVLKTGFPEYEVYLPRIKRACKEANYWHGTGRYHYRHVDGSRYAGIINDDTIDVLQSIISDNGLKPHHDPWIDSGGKTISLATVRMHARAFARIHASEEAIFLYELGSIKYWLRLYFLLLAVWLLSNFRSHLNFMRSLVRYSFSKDIQNWASAIRKPVNQKVISISDIFKGNIPTSDIKDNYPVLIGIATDSKHLIETIPLTHKVERRSLQSINLGKFTHLEVPFDKVKEIQQLLAEKKVNVKVLPLEFVDLYMSDVSLKQLAYT